MLNNGFGIMFHHFHDDKKYLKQQGSINKGDFLNILDYYNDKYNILDSNKWLEKAINNKLDKKDVCLTFDDGLKCQFDIANSILKDISTQNNKITAFYFVYTNIFTNNYSKLEVYRYFRNTIFKNIDDFYYEFFEILINDEKLGKKIKNYISKFNPKEYLIDFSFYTDNDKLFRYLRDNVIINEYDYFMQKIMIKYNFNEKDCLNKLWLSIDDIKNLHNGGNIIGIHSHSHPTNISNIDFKNQFYEYNKSKQIIEHIINDKVITMSHPCGSYNNTTLKILKELGIKIGFKSNMKPKGNTKYEFLREDHTNIIKRS